MNEKKPVPPRWKILERGTQPVFPSETPATDKAKPPEKTEEGANHRGPDDQSSRECGRG
jgi:hypothetical protein